MYAVGLTEEDMHKPQVCTLAIGVFCLMLRFDKQIGISPIWWEGEPRGPVVGPVNDAKCMDRQPMQFALGTRIHRVMRYDNAHVHCTSSTLPSR